MSFIDVSVYTMFIGSLGRFVVSIERIQDKVVLFGNAIYLESNKYLKLTSNPFNVDSQTLIIDNSSNSRQKYDPYIVKTMRFDDILHILITRNIRTAVMKVDIQWSEVFLCQTGNQTFEHIDIPVAPHYRILLSMTIIVEFFTSCGYIPTIDTCTELSLTNALKSSGQK